MPPPKRQKDERLHYHFDIVTFYATADILPIRAFRCGDRENGAHRCRSAVMMGTSVDDDGMPRTRPRSPLGLHFSLAFSATLAHIAHIRDRACRRSRALPGAARRRRRRRRWRSRRPAGSLLAFIRRRSARAKEIPSRCRYRAATGHVEKGKRYH